METSNTLRYQDYTPLERAALITGSDEDREHYYSLLTRWHWDSLLDALAKTDGMESPDESPAQRRIRLRRLGWID